MSGLTWEEPETGARKDWAAISAELQAHPGKWALVAENTSASIVSMLKKRYGLECTVRGVKESRAEKVFARWPE